MSFHPCTATASPLRLPLAHLIPVCPPPNLCHQPSHPGHCFWVRSYAWLLFCGPIYPFQARETFPKCPFGAEALHACESSPPWLATSCLGESRERRERHTALRWRNLQSLLRIPPHSSSFFIPSLCLLKHLLGKLDASKSLSPFPPPCSAKPLARGLKGSLGQPGSSQQPQGQIHTPALHRQHARCLSCGLASVPVQARSHPDAVRDSFRQVTRNKWTHVRNEARNPHGAH